MFKNLSKMFRFLIILGLAKNLLETNDKLTFSCTTFKAKLVCPLIYFVSPTTISPSVSWFAKRNLVVAPAWSCVFITCAVYLDFQFIFALVGKFVYISKKKKLCALYLVVF